MRSLLPLALLASAAFAQSAGAQSDGSSARESADRFQLDLPAAEDAEDSVVTGGEEPAVSEPAPSEPTSSETAPSEPTTPEDTRIPAPGPRPLPEFDEAPPAGEPEAAPVREAPMPARATRAAAPAKSPPSAGLSIDTPIAALIADKRSKAVLDWHMPGLSEDKNLEKFRNLSLRELAPLSGGRLTPDLLKKVGGDLDAIK